MNTKEEVKTKPMDFIYGGRRRVVGGLGDSLYPISSEGKLLAGLIFKAERSERVIGGRYRGAEFSGDMKKVRGIKVAKYVLEGPHWKGKETLEWNALHDQAKIDQRSESMEKEDRKSSPIDKEMAELRQLYAAMRNRGDHVGCAALENAVLLSLRSAR